MDKVKDDEAWICKNCLKPLILWDSISYSSHLTHDNCESDYGHEVEAIQARVIILPPQGAKGLSWLALVETELWGDYYGYSTESIREAVNHAIGALLTEAKSKTAQEFISGLRKRELEKRVYAVVYRPIPQRLQRVTHMHPEMPYYSEWLKRMDSDDKKPISEDTWRKWGYV